MNSIEASFIESIEIKIDKSEKDVLYYFCDYMLLLTRAEWEAKK